MKPVFLSIIIPIFNGEKTIERCLNSIWQQDISNDSFEVICVNDCSTDHSAEVIEKQMTYHKNLRLFSNAENLRAGGSRNRGVREANGEYILFIDADDYYHPGSVMQMMEYQMKHRLDILMYDFAREQEGIPSNQLVHQFPDKSVMSGRKFFVVNSLPYAPWKFMFKKNLMLSHGIFFEEKVSCEDVDWCHRIAFAAKTMKYEPILLTHYTLNPKGQTCSEFKKQETIFNRLFSGYRLYQLLDFCDTTEEKTRMRAVSESTLKNGVIFLNALTTSPRDKTKALIKYIPKDDNWRGLLKLAATHPQIYAWTSTIVSPIFRTLIKIKRFLRGR